MAEAHFDPIALAKGQQWEIAKGHLRAVAAIDGARCSSFRPEYMAGATRYDTVHDAIETFIRNFEQNGLEE